MKVLVTGGAGFIGSHIVEQLVAGGADVRVLDRVPPPASRGRSTSGSPTSPTTRRWRPRVDGVDAVCHQAAKVGSASTSATSVEYVAHNDVGTAALLRAVHDAGFAGRLVLASSMVVYGEGATGARPRRRSARRRAASRTSTPGQFEPPLPARAATPLTPEPVAEDAPLDPRNVYAATKVHQEHLLPAYARETGVPVTALRYHNVYGPRMPRDTPYAGVARIFRSALERGSAPGLRGRWPAPRLRARRRRRPRRTSWRSTRRRAVRRRVQRRQRRRRTPSCEMADGPRRRLRTRRAAAGRRPARGGSATSATSWPHRREPPSASGSSPGSRSSTGCASFATAPMAESAAT